MMTKMDSVRLEAARVRGMKLSAGGIGFDWVVIALSAWFLGGLFLDGWAHNHGAVDESFFTPWHGAFYSGFLAVAGLMVTVVLRNHARGYAWRRALPAGYDLSLLGVLIFGAGGLGDMIWHLLFGIEVDVEALLSPTHLSLALGMALMVSGPFRAAWQRSATELIHRWTIQLPMLLSLGFTLSLFTFMTMFAHPLVDVWAAPSHHTSSPFEAQALGVSSLLLQTVLLMGFVLITVRRWTPLPGGLTLIFTLNAVAMSFMHDQYRLIPAAALAGLVADLMHHQLKPSASRPATLRLFAFAVPAVFYLLYFLTLMFTGGIWWSIHLWTGSIVLAGIAGWLLSYLIVPPLGAEAPHVPEPQEQT